jgi:hypothetical protein
MGADASSDQTSKRTISCRSASTMLCLTWVIAVLMLANVAFVAYSVVHH